MDEAAWALSALLALAFFIAAVLATGFLQFGWFVLAIGMSVVAYVRFRARGNNSVD